MYTQIRLPYVSKLLKSCPIMFLVSWLGELSSDVGRGEPGFLLSTTGSTADHESYGRWNDFGRSKGDFFFVKPCSSSLCIYWNYVVVACSRTVFSRHSGLQWLDVMLGFVELSSFKFWFLIADVLFTSTNSKILNFWRVFRKCHFKGKVWNHR